MVTADKLVSKGRVWLLVAMLIFAACTAASQDLAALEVTPSSGRPGITVQVRGERFSSAADASDVHLRWNDADGRVLATVAPDQAGEFATTVSIPADAKEGFHVLVATQRVAGDDGEMEPFFGTPARASMSLHEPEPVDRLSAPGPEQASTRPQRGW